MVELLVSLKAGVDARDKNQFTALMAAAASGASLERLSVVCATIHSSPYSSIYLPVCPLPAAAASTSHSMRPRQSDVLEDFLILGDAAHATTVCV
jgi:hypothetical protein